MGQICDLWGLWLLVSQTQDCFKKFLNGRFIFQGLKFQNLESDLTMLQYLFVSNVFQNFFIAPSGHFG